MPIPDAKTKFGQAVMDHYTVLHKILRTKIMATTFLGPVQMLPIMPSFCYDCRTCNTCTYTHTHTPALIGSKPQSSPGGLGAREGAHKYIEHWLSKDQILFGIVSSFGGACIVYSLFPFCDPPPHMGQVLYSPNVVYDKQPHQETCRKSTLPTVIGSHEPCGWSMLTSLWTT